MVIHEESEVPLEMAIAKNPILEPGKLVIVKSHMREVSSNHEEDVKPNASEEQSPHGSENMPKKLRKNAKKNKIKDFSSTSSAGSDGNIQEKATKISDSDLEELRTVYKKCKSVIEKIEIKYGHLLNIEDDEGTSGGSKRPTNKIEEECQCTLNKKIVFDDDGRQSTIDMVVENHICPKKLKKTHSDPVENKNIQIEYYENEVTLPDDLRELSNILQNADLETTYRNKVIDKVRSIKQELTNEIKFNKPTLIEKLKLNPDEVLDFKGTNLSTLPGYS